MSEKLQSNRFKLLNTYVDNLTLEETVQCVEEIIKSRTPTQHVVINASKVNLLQEDSQLRSIVNSCPIINADGVSIVLAARLLGIPLKHRVTGCDLFLKLIEVASQKGYRIYLFGAKEEVVKRVKSIIEEQYPSLQIAGYRNGYFTDKDEAVIVKDMYESKSDMLFVAFSSPKKEYWIKNYINDIDIPFVMGVGGSFDIVAGVTKRAPVWMQKCGMEWFFRFIQEPRRMWKRYIFGNMQFIFLTLKAKLGLL